MFLENVIKFTCKTQMFLTSKHFETINHVKSQCLLLDIIIFVGESQDMLHPCEKLAQRGFVCASVDFAEGLSGAVPRQIARQEIVQEPFVPHLPGEGC